MSNNLTDEVRTLTNEIFALVQGYPKSSGALITKARTISISMPMELAPSGGWAVNQRTVVITATTTDSTKMICSISMNPTGIASDYNLGPRETSVKATEASGDRFKWEISVVSQDAEDIAVLKSGGALSLEMSYTITGSSNFEVEVNYV